MFGLPADHAVSGRYPIGETGRIGLVPMAHQIDAIALLLQLSWQALGGLLRIFSRRHPIL